MEEGYVKSSSCAYIGESEESNKRMGDNGVFVEGASSINMQDDCNNTDTS